MMMVKRFAALAAMAFLAACAGPAPTGSSLEETTRESVRVTGVTVDVSDMGAMTAGRPMSAADVKTAVESATTAAIVGQGSGSRDTRANVRITSVTIIDVGQAALIGGESVMKGTVSLVDARSGNVILAPVEISAGGGGWVLGGLIAAATLKEPAEELRIVSAEFASRARTVILGE